MKNEKMCESRDAGRCGKLGLAPVTMMFVLLATGCATTAVVDMTAPLALSVSLDRETYRIGDPLIATVTVINESTEQAELPRLDQQTVRFMYRERGMNVRVHRDPVFPANALPEPREIEPGASVSRRFLFTRMTEEEGAFAFIAVLKSAAVGGQAMAFDVFAAPAAYEVTGEVALRRDRGNGMVLKEQAVDLAKAEAAGAVQDARAVLVPLGDTGLYTWVVILTVETPEGEEQKYAVQVDPYVGKVRRLEARGGGEGAAPADDAKE